MDSAFVSKFTALLRVFIMIFLLSYTPSTVPLVTAQNVHNVPVNIELKKVLTALQMQNVLDLYVNNTALHSSLEASCNEQLLSYAEGIRLGKIWALQMLDSSSNVPPGVLGGNLVNLGMYDQCVSVKVEEVSENIRGRHCIYFLKVRGLHQLRLPTFALCLPSVCNSSAVGVILKNTVQQVPIFSDTGVDVGDTPYCSEPEPRKVSTEFYVALFILAMALSIIFLITLCDVLDRSLGKSSPLGSVRGLFIYSMYRSGREVFRPPNGSRAIPAIDGLRVISMAWVMIGHVVMSGIWSALVNSDDLIELQWRFSWLYTFSVTQSYYAVNTFIAISGFLTSFNFPRYMTNTNALNLSSFYSLRYLRIMSLLLVAIVASIILSNVVSGPLWSFNTDATLHSCQECYWSILLCIQNIVYPYNHCLPHLWYLAVDMQLHFFAPVLLYPLIKKPKLGYMLLALVVCLSMALQGIIISNNQIPSAFSYNISVQEYYDISAHVHKMPHTRVGTYCFGVLFGYLVAMQRMNLRRVHVWLGSLTAVLCFLFCTCLSRIFMAKDYEYNLTLEILYTSVSHPAWGFTVAWIIYMSIYDKKGLLARYLSLPIFAQLSRISYAFYMTHVILIYVEISTLRVPIYWDLYYQVTKLLVYFILSSFVALATTITIEIPIQKLLYLNCHEKRS